MTLRRLVRRCMLVADGYASKWWMTSRWCHKFKSYKCLLMSSSLKAYKSMTNSKL
ncbi:hypothetical protein SLEP1_g32760 [Rubroshorea leprosula]|uniref:Uncharacterized protein n=1 Tax=Rubroshorea leprosula TaxID=152421 RepID=A0AAV5KEF4_9ROSI|nr:hypothetical protein SLEP1_g32760 [Rubroshorea leprosula]